MNGTERRITSPGYDYISSRTVRKENVIPCIGVNLDEDDAFAPVSGVFYRKKKSISPEDILLSIKSKEGSVTGAGVIKRLMEITDEFISPATCRMPYRDLLDGVAAASGFDFNKLVENADRAVL